MKTLTLELTGRCHNNCKHCSSNSCVEYSDYIYYDKIVELTKDIVSLGFHDVILSGGEPFLHHEFQTIAGGLAHTCGLNVTVYTCGIIEDNYKDIIPIGICRLTDLKDRGVSKIVIGLYSLDKNIYSKFCQSSNNFDIVMKSIDNAVSVFQNQVELNIVPNKYNIGEIKDFVSFAISKGIGKVNFLGLVLQGRADKNRDDICLSLSEHKHLIETLDILSKVYPGYVRVGKPLKCGSCKECSCGVDKLVITPTGFVYGCESMKNTPYLIVKGEKIYPDNIYKKPLHEIYYGSRYLLEEKRLLDKYAKRYNGDIQSICPIQRAMWN